MPTAAPSHPPRPEAADPPVLSVQALGVRFGRQQVLRDISLDLPVGQTLVVLGESGCGKTVLLKSLIGLVRPTTGDVKFEGRSLFRMNDRDLAHLRTRYGFVFQGAALFDSHTIADNIAFPLREHTRLPPDEIADIVATLVDEVGLPRSVLTKKPVQLSGGMRKRAGIARAIVGRTQCILYDEPNSGLDPIVADVIDRMILRMQKRYGVTSLVVTHDMGSVFKISDRVAFLKRGIIHFLGTPAELKASADPEVRDFIEGRSGATS